MRISIWQQFSSNHSASFVIVGTFKSASDAEETATRLRNILSRIAIYWQQLPREEAETLWQKGDITPVEQEISQEFNVEWSKIVRGDDQLRRIDWIPFDPDKAVKAVVVLDRHVFVENFGNTDLGSEPFETILRRYATTVVGNYEIPLANGNKFMRFQLTCHAPDTLTAEKLMSDIRINWEGENKQDLLIGDGITDLMDGKVTRNGLEIRYSGLPFYHAVEILEDLTAYLKQHGCVNFAYEFMQE